MPDLRATRGLQATPAEPIPKLTTKVSQGRQRPEAAVGRSDRLGAWAGTAIDGSERPRWADSGPSQLGVSSGLVSSTQRRAADKISHRDWPELRYQFVQPTGELVPTNDVLRLGHPTAAVIHRPDRLEDHLILIPAIGDIDQDECSR